MSVKSFDELARDYYEKGEAEWGAKLEAYRPHTKEHFDDPGFCKIVGEHFFYWLQLKRLNDGKPHVMSMALLGR